MTRAPTFDDIFAVMSAASLGETTARVALPEEPDLAHTPTRFAVALNVLLHDLDYRVKQREKAEERLYQAQKMEAIGKLAGGVAHDFNNLLSVILGYADLLLVDVSPALPIHADLLEIRHAGERARELTQQLLAFGRRQMLEPRVLDLDAVLRGMQKMLARLVGEGVELELELGASLGKVNADPGQLELVMMNLVINARDAMPKGGKLAIATANAELDERYALEHPEVIAGSYVRVAVTDSGAGMTPAVRERIFEPFFTTKEQGRGTGLGLSTVFGIVRQSGGHIAVSSELGKGTTFELYLPRVLELPLEPQTVPPSPHSGPPGSETVLLVEDDAQVRALARIVLERGGYRVLDAAGPHEALALAEAYPHTIHLLLTDVVMPRMDGRTCAELMKPRRPRTRVLFMSGHAESAIVRDGVLEAGIALLPKPFTPDALLQAVRAALDGG
jgi:two-component system cell cycle sensor histidine kinase/response regulator CckA